MPGFDHFPCGRVYIVFVFIAIGGELQFKNRGPVVVVELLVIKHGVFCRNVGLGQGNLLRFFQGDVGGGLPALCICGVVIVAVNGHNPGRKADLFDHRLGAGAHIRQEMVAWEYRSGFQLQHNILFVPVDVLYKVSGLVDFLNQVSQDNVAVLADVIRVGFYNPLPLFILAGEGDHFSLFVVIDLNLRVHAQHQGSRFFQRSAFGCRCFRRAAAGQKGCCENRQGRDRCKNFSSQFHFDNSSQSYFRWLLFCLTPIDYGGAFQKPGSLGKIF